MSLSFKFKSKVQQERDAKAAKKRKAEEEAAEVYAAFVASFEDEEPDGTSNFVRAGDKDAPPRSRPRLAEASNGPQTPASGQRTDPSTGTRPAATPPGPPGLPTPAGAALASSAKKTPAVTLQSVFGFDDDDEVAAPAPAPVQMKSSSKMDSFMEMLKKRQEEQVSCCDISAQH